MSYISSDEIRHKFLEFMQSKWHAVIPSAPVVPENDPTVLFNTAGMQPLAPYLLWEAHPLGKRLADSQKCIRTNDIDEVGGRLTSDIFWDAWKLVTWRLFQEWFNCIFVGIFNRWE